jgi:hypothetical protein
LSNKLNPESHRQLPVEQLVLLDRLEALRDPRYLVARLTLAQHLAAEDGGIRIACNDKRFLALISFLDILFFECFLLTSKRDVRPSSAELVGGVAGVVCKVFCFHAADHQGVAAAAAFHVPR